MERSPKTDFAESSTQSQSTNSVVDLVFRDRKLYDIEDLTQVWKYGGWKALAELSAKLDVDLDLSNIRRRIIRVFEQAYNHMLYKQNIPQPSFRKFDTLLAFAEIPKGKSYSLEELKNILKPIVFKLRTDAELLTLMKKVINAFIHSKTVGEAFSKINKKNCQRFAEYFHKNKRSVDKLFSLTIDQQFADAMKWLVYGLDGSESCEEAFWNCVWLFTKPMITRLIEIKRCITDDIPLAHKNLMYLNILMKKGLLSGYFVKKPDGSQTYEVYLETRRNHIKYRGYSLNYIVRILLMHPAYCLAQELQGRCSKPRFVRRCRAPSCRRLFYTCRKNAKFCPGSQGNKKNECALQALRYKRYLEKIKKDPENYWYDKQLQKDFISYDNN